MSPGSIKYIVKPEPPEPLFRRLLVYRFLLGLAALILVTDQLSKNWIQARMPLGSYGPPYSIEVIPGFFNLIHVGNTGAAWSLFTGRSVSLAIVAALTLVAIYVWRRTLMLKVPLVQISFGLLCGGIIGNLIDRIQHGHVIDFIDLHFGSYIYPTFNVADSGITIGVILYLWHSLRTVKN